MCIRDRNTTTKKTNEETTTKTAVSAFELFWGCISPPLVLAGAGNKKQDEYEDEEEVEEVEEERDEHEDEYEDERVKTMATIMTTMTIVFCVFHSVVLCTHTDARQLRHTDTALPSISGRPYRLYHP